MTSERNPTSLAVVLSLLLGAICTVVRAHDAPYTQFLSELLSDRMISCTQGWGELRFDASVGATGHASPKLRIKDK